MDAWTGLGIAWELLALCMVIAIAGGVVRGLSGFGGAVVMTLPLALVLGPQRAVLTALLLEALAAGAMLREALSNARYRLITPICIASCLTVPFGSYLLLNADPRMLRQMMAGVVIAFSVILLKGLRYSGSQRIGTSIAIGAASGVLLGATSMGGPPIMLYLLSGPDSARVNRANLSLCVQVLTLAGLAAMWAGGILNAEGALGALTLAPCFYAGVMLGIRLFPRINEQRFRQFALLLLATVSAISLLIG